MGRVNGKWLCPFRYFSLVTLPSPSACCHRVRQVANNEVATVATWTLANWGLGTLTHLGNVPSGAAKVDERHVDEIGAVTDRHRLLLQRVLLTQSHNLTQLVVLQGERKRDDY